MKAVVQRVTDASVSVGAEVCGSIASGILVYLGVARGDTENNARYLADKIADLRIFADKGGKMNLSVKDRGGAVLAVSQFTLLGDARKGRRPYFGEAADPAPAQVLYECFMEKIRSHGLSCAAGIFRAHMKVRCTNDGPVTILLDSGQRGATG
jgi:D-tyrosyl-tRNA(Tyr) deacylase